MKKRFAALSCLSVLIFASALIWCSGCKQAQENLPDIEDGSAWEKVMTPGFGNAYNTSVVAMTEYNGYLYAMARNDMQGVEMWRSADGKAWEQVLFPGGETNGLYGNTWVNGLWGNMAVFKGKLYCGFSSGVQGQVRRSTGCEIWRYDGATWDPIISDKRDVDDQGSITAISGCAANDGDFTATFTDASKHWTANQWAGGTLQITSGTGKFRRFDIVGNTETTLTVQQDEQDNTADSTSNPNKKEYTVCAAQHFSNPYPPHESDIEAVASGDTYEIGLGWDENGFGDSWNRMVTGMVEFEGKLYVSTGLNYERGGQIWYTEDGTAWSVTQPANSFGNYHEDDRFPEGKKPISTSITDLVVSGASGAPTLYAGGTGASGNKGRCSRLARLTDTGWQLIVDATVDDNDEGSNENGFGCGMDCSMYNGDFMPWSLADYQNKIFVGIQSLAGARIMYSPTGSPDDGSWFHAVGGADGKLPNGFDGKKNGGAFLYYQQIAANLFVGPDALYAGTVTFFSPTMGATQQYLTGAQLWKSADGMTWAPVTRNGFGDPHAISFDAFAMYKGQMYASINKGCIDCPDTLDPAEGGMIWRRVATVDEPKQAYSLVEKYETTMGASNDPTDIYYPTDTAPGDQLPMALLLQGGRCGKQYYSHFASEVAKYGFIVAVPNHYHEFTLMGFVDFKGLFSEMSQITGCMDYLKAQNADPASPLHNLVDTGSLMMLGHSYGSACAIYALQNQCMAGFCPEGAEFTRPPEMKAAALCGINSQPHGKPLDYNIYSIDNLGMPLGIVNGRLDNNAKYDITKITYSKIADAPKMAAFIEGANHYAMCDINNLPAPGEGLGKGPGEDPNTPTLDQETSSATAARWCALFLRAYGMNDQAAKVYIEGTGKWLDPNVKDVLINGGN